eukprot:438253_1
MIYLSLIGVLITAISQSQNCPIAPCALAYKCNSNGDQCENIECTTNGNECAPYLDHSICDYGVDSGYCLPSCTVSKTFCSETWGSGYQYCNPASGICEANPPCAGGSDCSAYPDNSVCETIQNQEGIPVAQCVPYCTVSAGYCLYAWGKGYPTCMSDGICDVAVSCSSVGNQCTAYVNAPICDSVVGICRGVYDCRQETPHFCATFYSNSYICEQASGECVAANCVNTPNYCNLISTNTYDGFPLTCNNDPADPQCELGNCATNEECQNVLQIMSGSSIADPVGYCNAENKCEENCVQGDVGCDGYYAFLNDPLITKLGMETAYEYMCNPTSKQCEPKPCQETGECTGSNKCEMDESGGICSLECSSVNDCSVRVDFGHYDHIKCDGGICVHSPPSASPTSASPTSAPSVSTSPPIAASTPIETDICVANVANRCHGKAKNCHRDSGRSNSKYLTFGDEEKTQWCAWCLCADISDNPLEECAYYALDSSEDDLKAAFAVDILKDFFMEICFENADCTFDKVKVNDKVTACDCEQFTCDGIPGTNPEVNGSGKYGV